MASDVSLAIRSEAAMRSIEKSLTTIIQMTALPRRHRIRKMLHVLQLEHIATALDSADFIKIAADNQERQFEEEAAAIMGKSEMRLDGKAVT